MRLLHTSDWHLGRSLHRCDLRAAQADFLDHLVQVVRSERVDAVLVSGDVYDRAVPPVDAVELCESALVRLTRDNRLGERAGAFGKFVQQIFSFRRKTLRKALSNAGFDAEAMLTATGHDGQLRPETFTPEQFLGMFDAAAAARVVS